MMIGGLAATLTNMVVFDVVVPASDDRKTKVWAVFSKYNEKINKGMGTELGIILWKGAWRKYCFIPNNHLEVHLDSSCFRELAQFMDDHRGDRR